MRFLNLQLLRFGHFEDAVLDFGSTGSGLHIIYGDNEAGKSTALRAIGCLLYGFPNRISDNFNFDYGQLRVGAKLARGDETLEFIRRKQGKRLQTPDGEDLSEDRVADYLGHTPKEVYEKLYRLDLAELLEGGQGILQGQGDIAETLFSAAAANPRIDKLLASLDEDAGKLFKERATTSVIARAIAEFDSAKKRIGASSQSAPEYDRLRLEIEKLAGDRAEAESRVRALTIRLFELDRLQRNIPRARRRRQLLDELAEVGDAVLLPSDAPARRQKASTDLAVAASRIAHLEERNAILRADIENTPVNENLLSESDTIRGLYERIGQYRKEMQDLPKHRGELRQLEIKLEQQLKSVATELTLDDAKSLKLNLAQSSRVHDLAGELEKIRASMAALKGEIERTDIDLTDVRKRVESATHRDVRLLESVLDRYKTELPPDEERRRLRQRVVDDRRQLDMDLGRLRPWQGTLESLSALPFPTSESVSRFDAAYVSLAAELAGEERRLVTLKGESQDADTHLQRLIGDHAPPSMEDWRDARKHRDSLWDAMRSELLGNDPSGSRGANAALDFATAVGNADHLAERIIVEHARVAEVAEAGRKLADAQSRLSDCAQSVSSLVARRDLIDIEWSELWEQVEIAPRTPIEMRGWLDTANEIIARAKRWRDFDGEVRALNELERQIVEQLRGVLTGVPTTLDGTGVARYAESQLQEARKLESEHNKDRAILHQLDSQKRNAESRLAMAQRKLERWKSEWALAMEPLRQPGDTRPSTAQQVLDGINEMLGTLEMRDNELRRVTLMAQNTANYRSSVADLFDRLNRSVDLDQLDSAITTVNKEVGESQKARQSRNEKSREISENVLKLTNFHATRNEAEAALTALARLAGCESADDLPEAERRSHLRRELEKELHTVQTEMRADTVADQSVDELATLAEAADGAELEFERTSLQTDRSTSETELSDLIERIGGLNNQLSSISDGDSASEPASVAESVLASLENHVNNYARLRIGEAVLRRAIDSFRRKNQAPLMNRAEETFARLTLGSFRQLKVDKIEKTQRVFGVRENQDQVEVAGMSEGTRDQLYLAFRLAALELQIASAAEPLPFIVDDILVNFDDSRARAALEVLSELASKTQVLLFTHHRRMLELAAALPAVGHTPHALHGRTL